MQLRLALCHLLLDALFDVFGVLVSRLVSSSTHCRLALALEALLLRLALIADVFDVGARRRQRVALVDALHLAHDAPRARVERVEVGAPHALVGALAVERPAHLH